ncbi:hypothetical protein TKK_0007740 [Trichogramma kaykai]
MLRFARVESDIKDTLCYIHFTVVHCTTGIGREFSVSREVIPTAEWREFQAGLEKKVDPLTKEKEDSREDIFLRVHELLMGEAPNLEFNSA